MKKKVWSKNGMKQIIDSGWKLFDKQTNTIFSGQCMANTQYSMCIRPWKETECNGFHFPEGHLQDCDLKPFSNYRIPEYIKQILTDKEREKGVILYMFFTTNKEGRIEPFCWVVTDYNYKLIRHSIVCGYKQNYQKRYDAVKEAMSYIIND